MKVRAYIKVGKASGSRRPKVRATTRPTPSPLVSEGGEVLPTVAFAVDLVIPDAAFKVPVVAELELPEDAVSALAEVKMVDAS